MSERHEIHLSSAMTAHRIAELIETAKAGSVIVFDAGLYGVSQSWKLPSGARLQALPDPRVASE